MKKILLLVLILSILPLAMSAGDKYWIHASDGSSYINGTDICVDVYGTMSCLSDAVVGAGDITAVNTNGPYLTGGGLSGAISLLLDESYLNGTIAAIASTYGGGNSSFNQTLTDSLYISQADEGNLNINSSDYWDTYNTANTTWFENIAGVLSLKLSELTSWTNTWFSTKTTDDLTEGSTNLYDNSSWNESHADTLYATIGSGGNESWNETYANTLYAPINYGDDWNKTYADTLYADISITGDNSSFNQTLTDSLYTYTAGVGLNLTGLEFNIEPDYAMPQGCNNGEIAEYNTTSNAWDCAVDNSASSGMSNWVLAAEGVGGSEEITDGETVTFGFDDDYIQVSRATNNIGYSFNETKMNETGDERYVNIDGDTWEGDMSAGNYNLTDIQQLVFNTTGCNETSTEGTVCWNSDDQTLNIVTGASNVIQVGQEQWALAKNGDSEILYNGQVVSVVGSSGDRGLVAKADASNISIASRLSVVTTDSCAVSADCPVTTFGRVRGLDTSAWADGTLLYLSDDGSGNLTSTVPEFPNFRVLIAFVVRSHANDGIIFVQPQIDYTDGVTLNELYVRNNLTVEGSINTTVLYGDVKIDTINGQTYQYLQDWIDTTQSAGKVLGGTFTSNGDGTVNVSSGSGFIKISDSATANTILFDWDINTSVSLTDESTNYIYVDYNSGNPIIKNSLIKVNNRDKILLGKIFREGTTLHTYEAGMYIAEATKNTLGRFTSIDGEFTRANGLILSETGTLNIAMTSGEAWGGLTMVNIAAFNSSLNTFEYYHYDGANWQELAENQINNTHYNDITTGLEELTVNRYGVHWAYVDNDGHIMVLFGQGDYTLALATASQPPSDLPDHIKDFGELIGRIIVQKGDTTFTNVDIPSDFVFTSTGATDYNSLSNTPTSLSEFIDDLGDRGYTSNLNFTNDAGYYNASDFSIADYFTSVQVLAFNYYNATSFLISDYFTKSEILGFGYYNSSDFSISDYFTSSQILGFSYYNATDFDIADYSTTSQADALYADIGVTTTITLPAENITTGTFGTGDYVMDGNLTVEKLVFETEANHFIESNSTCVIIRGDTSILEIC